MQHQIFLSRDRPYNRAKVSVKSAKAESGRAVVDDIEAETMSVTVLRLRDHSLQDREQGQHLIFLASNSNKKVSGHTLVIISFVMMMMMMMMMVELTLLEYA